MAKKFLSFLGTNNYVACTYYYENQEVRNIRFVQEALVHLYCAQWAQEDKILIFVTPEANKKNWGNNGHGTDHIEGLGHRLHQLNLHCPIQQIPIPDGKSEKEIWDIFNIMCQQLDSNDEIILDITHALRSLPVLAMVVLQYMRVLKNITLNGIFYGAFEVLGFAQKVKEMPLEERRAPVFDLTAFARLADWSVAVDRFLAAGDAGPINELVKLEAIPVIKSGPSHNLRKKEAMIVKNLAKRLLDFTNAMSTCRGRSISECANSLYRALDECQEADLVPPLVPLLEKIRERTTGFSGSDEIRDGIRAAGWCLDHNLVQQAYTILHETGISFFLLKAEEASNGIHPLNVKKRNMVTGAASLLAQKKDSSEGCFPDDYEKLWQKLWKIIGENDENFRTMSLLEQHRNDLNYAGMNDGPIRADKFEEPVRQAIAWFEKTVNR